jgi:tRNA A-37 threonylcarbamoyl transferase component Bud32
LQAGDNIVELCIFISEAADAVKSQKSRSRRLKERIHRLEPHLLQKAKSAPAFTQTCIELLEAIGDFLNQLKHTKVMEDFVNHQQVTASFANFDERLNELVADVHSVDAAAVAPADLLQDQVDDFEAQQAINRDLLPSGRAQEVNKQLQNEAPEEFTGFVEIDFNTLILENLLGEGTFGIVHKGKWSGESVVVKVANCTSLDEHTIKMLRRELRVHALPQLRHERIAAVIGASTVAPNVALVMEYAQLGTVHDLLYKDNYREQLVALSLTAQVQMLHDIAVAVQHLHRNGIVHGNIKSCNALLFEGFRVKVCDAGLATVSTSVSTQSQRNLTVCTTPSYVAPEVLSGNAITYTSDVYSYSMVMFEVNTGTQPYSGMNQDQIHVKVLSGERPTATASSVSVDCAPLVPLMQQCWHQDAAQRPDFTTIVDQLQVLLVQQQQPILEPQRPLIQGTMYHTTSYCNQMRASVDSSINTLQW